MIFKPALSRLFLKLQWIVIPLLIVAAVEYALRTSDVTIPLWYSRAEAIARQGNVDFVFIGSSKVAAAFVENQFDNYMSGKLGKKIVSINLGQGFSTPQLHYLGLRNLFREYPASFKNVTVFIEALGDTPLYQYHHDWNSEWISRQPQLLVPLLRFWDLKPFWESRRTTSKEKLWVTLKYLMSQSYIINYRERVKQKIEIEGKELIDRVIRLISGLPPLPPEPEPVIQPIGGIHTDPVRMKRAREIGLSYFKSLSQSNGRILKRWDISVLGDIVRLVKSRGGKVCFVNLPTYSVEMDAYRTQYHETNKRIIKKQLAKWCTVLLTPDFAYTDEDIPDYFHLGISRAGEFTVKLARAYLENIR